MKLGDIYYRCRRCYNTIKNIRIIEKSLNNYYIDGLSCISYVFDELKDIKCLEEEYIEFSDSVGYDMQEKKFEDYTISMDDFEKAREKILASIRCIMKMYEELGIKSKEDIGLDIKFPIAKNFSDFRKDIDELDFILTKCPFFQDEKESLRFENVDIGSFWLTFALVGGSIVGGSILLNNIAAFVDKCIVIRSHYLTIQQQKANMEKAQVEQKEKEEIIKALNRYYKIAVDNAISELEEITNCKLQDGDERGRVEQSIEKMGKLIDKGMQIYATIDSPEETKVLFEPLEMHYLEVDKQLKLLEDKKEEEK